MTETEPEFAPEPVPVAGLAEDVAAQGPAAVIGLVTAVADLTVTSPEDGTDG
jgi:hypothetical protein